MSKDNVISLEYPEWNADVLTDLLRSGARELIKKAVQTELAEFLSQYQDRTDAEGKTLVVRNGYLPEREIMTGIGPVDIKVPKTRDRGGQGIHFRSELLPPYIKRTKSVETVLPWLYLKGISTGAKSHCQLKLNNASRHLIIFSLKFKSFIASLSSLRWRYPHTVLNFGSISCRAVPTHLCL